MGPYFNNKEVKMTKIYAAISFANCLIDEDGNLWAYMFNYWVCNGQKRTINDFEIVSKSTLNSIIRGKK
jgi:hypothetical protein